MINIYANIQWINSNGGPLILLSKHLLKFWMGYYLPHPSIPDTLISPYVVTIKELTELQLQDVKTDYDRACEIKEYIAPLPIKNEVALILGDESCPTSWWPEPTGGVIVRLQYTDNTETILYNLTTLPAHIWDQEPFYFYVPDKILVLFDATDHGNQLSESIEIKLETGTYQIFTAIYSPNTETSLILHRFIKY